MGRIFSDSLSYRELGPLALTLLLQAASFTPSLAGRCPTFQPSSSFLRESVCLCVCVSACTHKGSAHPCVWLGKTTCAALGIFFLSSFPCSLPLEVPGREEKSEVSGVEVSGSRPFQSLSYLHFSLRNRLGLAHSSVSSASWGVLSHLRVGAWVLACSGSWLGSLSTGGNIRGQYLEP